jgi:hypothetical protein
MPLATFDPLAEGSLRKFNQPKSEDTQMEIIKRFRYLAEDVLGVRFNRKMTDREHAKHGNTHIDHFDVDGHGRTVFISDWQKYKGNPTLPGMTEAIDRPIYDMQVVTNATTSLDLFQVPRSGSTKTINETNMTQAGVLPSPEKLTIKRIGNVILTAVLADFQLIAWQVVFTFTANSKIYTQGPLFYYGAGMGISGQTTANNTSVLTLNVPGENGVRSLVYDIPINPQDPFNANLEMHGSGSIGARTIGAIAVSASTEVKCILQGPSERAI